MDPTATTRYAGAVAIIDVAGRIGMSEGLGVMRDAIRREVAAGHKNILLNLAGVTYIDSSGLGEMASAYIKVSGMGGKLKLVNTRAKVRGLLEITRLYTLLVTYASEADALASFGE